MRSKAINYILCVLLLMGVLSPAALAAEEPAPAEMEYTEAAESPDGELPMEGAETEEPASPETEETPLPEETSRAEAEPLEETTAAAEAGTEEAGEPAEEPEEPAEEEPVEESEEALSGGAADEFADPEDPLYARMTARLDGAYGTKHSEFVTRALNNETLYKGIDVSSWQGAINWNEVKAAGIEFVFIRCGYRGLTSGKVTQDGRFTDYIYGAKAAGLKVGVYIFSQAITKAEAVEEAEFVLKMVSGYSIDLPLVFDLEHCSGGRFTAAGLSKRENTDMAIAFCQRIEQAGYQSMVYSNPSMLRNDFYPNELGRLWLANFTTQTEYTARGYEYWQCSDIGTVSGISTAVDLDFWFKPSGAGVTQPVTPSSQFTDVTASDWYYDTVMRAYQAGIVKGMTDTSFQPKGTATRGQVVTMLYRMEGSPSWSKAASFTDLTQSYYVDAVSWAAEKGVVSGYSATSFGPGKAITRQELVAILYRMSGSPGVQADLTAYGDASAVGTWAREAMTWAVEKGIITGYEDNTLRPGANASRAEVCTILMRYAAL